MEKLYKIREALTQELEKCKTAKSGELQGGELEAIHKITDTIKNIDKICMLAEQSGYSQDGGQGGSYGGGSSYANRGQHYVRGHYSRDGGNSYDGGNDGSYSSRRGGSSNRVGSRGGYSRNGGYSRGEGTEEMMEHVRMAIETAPDEYREDIKRFMRELEQG